MDIDLTHPAPSATGTREPAPAVVHGPEAGARLFLEHRSDLVLMLRDRGEPEICGTHARGLAWCGSSEPQRHLYWADPSPESVPRALARAIERADVAWLAEADAPLDTAPAHEHASALVERLVARCPGAAVSVRWVGFEQRVCIVAPGETPASDMRRAARLRAEVRGAGSAAAMDLVLPARGVMARLDTMARILADRHRTRVDARPVSPGAKSVVFAPGVGGILVHELIGHALEADSALAGRSWLAGDAPRFRCGWTVLDDPRRGRASWRIDDEGSAARATPLVRDGRVTGLLHDRTTARQGATRSTGHGRRSSFREPVRPRMGCTFVAAGPRTPEEVLAGVADGIYVRRMEAASVDPWRGRATFRVSDADRIVRGRIEEPLEPHVLRVDGAALLSLQVRVANDPCFDPCVGSCHRDGQPIPVSVGAPTICIGCADVLG